MATTFDIYIYVKGNINRKFYKYSIPYNRVWMIIYLQ